MWGFPATPESVGRAICTSLLNENPGLRRESSSGPGLVVNVNQLPKDIVPHPGRAGQGLWKF